LSIEIDSASPQTSDLLPLTSYLLLPTSDKTTKPRN